MHQIPPSVKPNKIPPRELIRRALAQFPAETWHLQPIELLRIAQNDLERANARTPRQDTTATRFLPRHIRRAKTARDVLDAAIGDRPAGTSFRQPQRTRLVYESETALKAAIAIYDAIFGERASEEKS